MNLDFQMQKILKIANLIFVVFCTYAYAQPAIQPFDMEVTTTMLHWKKGEVLDKNIRSSLAVKKWRHDYAEEYFYYTEIDINGDRAKEILIAGTTFPARGRGYLLLKRSGNNWIDIASWRGGFIFHKESKNVKAYDIHIFEKDYGEMYYAKAKWKGNKFSNEFVTLLPRTIYDSSFYEFWQSLNSIDDSK